MRDVTRKNITFLEFKGLGGVHSLNQGALLSSSFCRTKANCDSPVREMGERTETGSQTQRPQTLPPIATRGRDSREGTATHPAAAATASARGK